MIQFNCSCGQPLQAEDDRAGQTIRCPECGREQGVPGGAGVQTADAPRSLSRPQEEAVQERPDHAGADRGDQPRPPTSRMAIGSMVLGVLSLFCNLWTSIPAIVLGAIALWDIGRSQGRKKGEGLAITGIVAGLVLPILMLLAVQKVREWANRVSSVNNLKQISLAMHDYNAVNATLPPAAICDAEGKPLLSWRVAVLPYIEQGALYNQFKLDESWDGPNNSKLLSQMPKYYALPGDNTAPSGYTYYRVFVVKEAAVGLHTAFDWCKGAHIPRDFPDGQSNTILVVEAANAVPWTKPDELIYDDNGPIPSLGGHFSGGFHVAFVSGDVRFLPSTISPDKLAPPSHETEALGRRTGRRLRKTQ